MAPTAARTVAVRAATVADDDAIERIFDQTLVLGARLERLPVAFDAYRALCLGWYLGAGRHDAAVAIDADGEIVGYALVCSDQRGALRWERRSTVRLAGRVIAAACTFQLDRASRRFYALRLRDAVSLARTRTQPPAAVHAHLNVVASHRSMRVALALVGHIDHRCRSAGNDTWFAEMNERAGARVRALERIGLEVVEVAENHTLGRLLGEPVRRLTLVRRADAPGPLACRR